MQLSSTTWKFNYIYYEVFLSFLCGLGEIWFCLSHLQREFHAGGEMKLAQCKWLKRAHRTMGPQDYEAFFSEDSKSSCQEQDVKQRRQQILQRKFS